MVKALLLHDKGWKELDVSSVNIEVNSIRVSSYDKPDIEIQSYKIYDIQGDFGDMRISAPNSYKLLLQTGEELLALTPTYSYHDGIKALECKFY